MKLLLTTIVSFLCIFSNLPPTEKVVIQNISLDHPTVTIKSTLGEAVEIIYTDAPFIEIETILSGASEDVLNYAISAGHFRLQANYSWEEASVTLEEKRINTLIFYDGKAQKPRKRYRVKLPASLNFIP
ncbi:MAG: hypothetical protein AAF985_27505 [Bacteroidota bacterium]